MTDILTAHPEAQRAGGGWLIKCPCHDDAKSSLSISESNDGRLLARCHAGCGAADVLRELNRLHGQPSERNAPRKPQAPPANPKGRIVASYDYHDEQGSLLFQALRMDPKSFRQRRPDGNGGWTWSLDDVRRVPYQLPELLAAVRDGRLIAIVEGEKDADRLRSLSIAATTNPCGAGKWRSKYNQYFTGASVVIIPDNDQPGRQHAEQVAASLSPSAASVKVLRLDGLPEKGDVSDWLDAGGTAEKLLALAEAAPAWEPMSEGVEKTPRQARRPLIPLTDLGNAERFIGQHGRVVRFDSRVGAWRVWNGRCWEIDQTGGINRLAHKTARSIYGKAQRATDSKEAEALAKWARCSESRDRMNAMLDVARALENVTPRNEEWDSDSWAFNVENGTIDLRTGKLRNHDPGDLITRIAPVRFVPDARHTVLDKVLSEALPDDELRRYLKRVLGYALCGEKREKLLAFAYGPRDSAKSTIFDSFQLLLGDYAVSAEPETFSVKNSNNQGAVSPEVARLAGVRYVLTAETNENHKLDSALVKRITGGERVVARFPYGRPFEFQPQFLIVLMSNHRPVVSESDEALWARLRVVPFEHSIPLDKRDPSIKRTLEHDPDARAALLAFAVEGCLEWQTQGLNVPDAVKRATGEYRDAMDLNAEFFGEHCRLGPDLEVQASELRKAYEAWARERKIRDTLSPVAFADRLRALGCEQRRLTSGPNKGRATWRGIGLEGSGEVGEASEVIFGNFSTRREYKKKFTELGSPASPASPQSEIRVVNI